MRSNEIVLGLMLGAWSMLFMLADNWRYYPALPLLAFSLYALGYFTGKHQRTKHQDHSNNIEKDAEK